MKKKKGIRRNIPRAMEIIENILSSHTKIFHQQKLFKFQQKFLCGWKND